MPNTDQNPAGLSLILIQFYSFLEYVPMFLNAFLWE